MSGNRFRVYDYGEVLFYKSGGDYHYLGDHEPAEIRFNADTCALCKVSDRDINGGVFDGVILKKWEEMRGDTPDDEEFDDHIIAVDYTCLRLITNYIPSKLYLLNKLLGAIEDSETDKIDALLSRCRLTKSKSWDEWFKSSIPTVSACNLKYKDVGDGGAKIHLEVEVFEDKLPDYKSLLEGELVLLD